MSDQMVVLPVPQLETIIRSIISTELTAILQNQEHSKEERPIVYRSRKYVKDLLQTSYPTLQKYIRQGIIKPVYFGRKVLFREDELDLALPKVRTILLSNKKGKAA